MRGQGVQPVHPVGEMRQFTRHGFLLARAQVSAHFQDGVAGGQGVEPFQFAQHIHRQPAAAGAQFQHLAAGLLQDRRNRLGQRAAEQRRHFRRGDKVARRAQLGCARRVVTQAGRIERGFHVLRKRYPAARVLNLFLEMLDDALAVGEGVGGRGWQHAVDDFMDNAGFQEY